jgi:membrane-bound metal-dependent hydrolase YbcI (DUF457 family)
MEPVTHALASLALSRAGLNRTSRLTTPLMVVAGLAADLDLLSYLAGPSVFLEIHGTLLHSLLGSALAMCVLAAAACMLDRRVPGAAIWGLRRKRPDEAPLSFGTALILCSIAGGVHLLLDLCGTYGVRLFWPFRDRWYAWDLTSALDLWVLLILLVGLLLPALFQLVSEEIGERRKPRRIGVGPVVALVLVGAYCGWRGSLHARAVQIELSRDYHGAPALSAGAFPLANSPLEWRGVVATDGSLETLEVSFAPGSTFDPDRSVTRYKPDASPALDAAEHTETARRFVRYAQFPLATIVRIDDGYECSLRDLRFAVDSHTFGALAAVIKLDVDGHVIGQELRFEADSGP